MSNRFIDDDDWWIIVLFCVLFAAASAGCLGTHRAGPGDQQCQDPREVGGC
jgi:hypothetical protein